MRVDNYKLYKQIRKDSSDRIFNDIWQKEKAKKQVRRDKYDPIIQKKGLDWFNSGLSFDDAPEELRKNTNFVNGFNKGKRLAMIEEMKKEDKVPSR